MVPLVAVSSKVHVSVGYVKPWKREQERFSQKGQGTLLLLSPCTAGDDIHDREGVTSQGVTSGGADQSEGGDTSVRVVTFPSLCVLVQVGWGDQFPSDHWSWETTSLVQTSTSAWGTWSPETGGAWTSSVGQNSRVGLCNVKLWVTERALVADDKPQVLGEICAFALIS